MTTAQRVTEGPSGKRRNPALPRLDAFLEAKLHPPTSRRKWVRRDRVVRALDEAVENCALTLVAAPAGYGKTTVVAQWLDQLAGRELAWIALDAADNDPVRLWTHIGTALERAGCRSAGGDAASQALAHRADLTGGLLPELVNALANAATPILLVLDDYHFIRARACHEQVDFLIDHLPPQVSVLVLTRADPPFRLGRLRAARKLAEIRADLLAFDPDEATVLLGMENVELSDVALSELMRRTEGWPAGLYLATLSLTGRDDPNGYVHDLSADDRYIGDYLLEEVLSRESAEVRSFILEASIFERFSPALCEYVLQTPAAGRIMHDLERSNLFLVALDAKRRWFRFHHLFAAVARSELQADNPRRVRKLHARAADWFWSHGVVEEAVGHAIAAGSNTQAARMVQANWIRYVDAGRAVTVEAWLRELRVPELEADPAALVTAAWMAVVRGDEATLNRILAALDGVDDDRPLPDGTHSIASAVALIQGIGGFGGPRQMAAAAQQSIELETDSRSPWFGAAQLVRGHERYVAGDLEAAMIVLPRAAYHEHSFAMMRQFALATMSMAAREQDEPSLSRKYAAEAMAVLEEASLRPVPQASMTLTAWADCQAMDGDLDAAMVTLDEVTMLRRRNPGLSPWPGFYHLLTWARVTTIAGDLVRAEALLDEVAGEMTRFTEGMEAMQGRLADARRTLRGMRGGQPAWEPLTAREIDVLRLLRSQLSLAEIAVDLFLTRNTVKTHARAVYRKLGASSRTEAVRLGRQRSLI